VCPECGGIRYFRYDVPFGHPMFGRNFPCPKCNADALVFASGLNPIERQITFADIETQGRTGAAKMLNAARIFIAGGRCGFLTVHGGFGNGKSTLLKAIVNDCITAGVDARYITMTEVMVCAREAFDSQQQGDSDYGRIAKLAKTTVLVIDELDKARVTDYAREVQTHLFDVRYRNAHQLGTVVAWNGHFDAIDLPWVRSRLSAYPVVENTDADMRPLIGGMA
jgi:DNA replication protein DnaC